MLEKKGIGIFKTYFQNTSDGSQSRVKPFPYDCVVCITVWQVCLRITSMFNDLPYCWDFEGAVGKIERVDFACEFKRLELPGPSPSLSTAPQVCQTSKQTSGACPRRKAPAPTAGWTSRGRSIRSFLTAVRHWEGALRSRQSMVYFPLWNLC